MGTKSGMLYKRGESRFWWIKYYRNGRPVRESTGTGKETQARRILRKRLGDLAAGRLSVPSMLAGTVAGTEKENAATSAAQLIEKMVGRGRIELPTPGFSVLVSLLHLQLVTRALVQITVHADFARQLL